MNYLFTTPGCPNCPRAKQAVAESALEVQGVDASLPEGLSLAKDHQVMQVPSLLIHHPDQDTWTGYHGLENILAYLSAL